MEKETVDPVEPTGQIILTTLPEDTVNLSAGAIDPTTGTITLVKEINLTTGSIALVQEEADVTALLSTEELHLLGQHDQSSHGKGGGGGAGNAADKAAAGENTGVSRAMGPAVISKSSTKGINRAATMTKDKQKEMDEHETWLEGKRDSAADDVEKRMSLGNYNKYAKAEQELYNHRLKMYSPDQVDSLLSAEWTVRTFNTASKTGNLVPVPSKKLEMDLIKGGQDWWKDEPSLLKKEFRGEKIPMQPHKVGSTLKNGEWPKPATPGSRPITTVAQAGRFGRVEVDGIKVKAAYEVTAADGTKIRAYDMSRGKGKDTDQTLATAAYMHDLYPSSPPKKVVFLSGNQMSRAAGFGTNAFVVAGTDYVFMNKKPLKISDPDWSMPAARGADAAHYTATHEFGHQFDFSNRRRSSVGLFETPSIKRHISEYGRSNSKEGYAESFAEWHVSEGKTTNPAARAYAQHNNWYGSGGKGALAAAIDGLEWDYSTGRIWIPMEMDVVEWDPWEIAEALGVIALADEEESSDVNQPEDDEDTIFTKMPKGLPIIAEDWETGKPKLLNMVDGKATDADKAEAEEIARKVYEDLGLDWED